MAIDITVKGLARLFKERIAEIAEEPGLSWPPEKRQYTTEADSEPSIKLAIGNVSLDYDLWQGLRNPAMVGLYPAGLPEIWDFFAFRTKQKVDDAGRATIFQIPKSFEFAQQQYSRAVIISVMLPFSSQIITDYADIVLKKKKGSSYLFKRMAGALNEILDKATARVAMDLFSEDSVAIAMNNDNVKAISSEAIPLTRQGVSHGPGKVANYSQKSIGVLMGLGQFGVSRTVFRDEILNGKVRRFSGPIRSVIIFDKQDLVKDGSHGIIYPTEGWRNFLIKLFNFTHIEPEVNKYRFCSYIPINNKSCSKCIGYCPSGALTGSTPSRDGVYPERILSQSHRFWKEKLQFD